MHVDSFLTYIGYKDDEPYLKSKLLDVNMRLFRDKNNPNYRRIVQSCAKHLQSVALRSLEGYTTPYGISGANVGIPFNIIGIVRNRGKTDAYCDIMLNPKIKMRSPGLVRSLSNCGSIRLTEPIEIYRHEKIGLSWFTIDGDKRAGILTKQDGGFTVQHEVDHNNGILITDLKTK